MRDYEDIIRDSDEVLYGLNPNDNPFDFSHMTEAEIDAANDAWLAAQDCDTDWEELEKYDTSGTSSESWWKSYAPAHGVVGASHYAGDYDFSADDAYFDDDDFESESWMMGLHGFSGPAVGPQRHRYVDLSTVEGLSHVGRNHPRRPARH